MAKAESKKEVAAKSTKGATAAKQKQVGQAKAEQAKAEQAKAEQGKAENLQVASSALVVAKQTKTEQTETEELAENDGELHSEQAPAAAPISSLQAKGGAVALGEKAPSAADLAALILAGDIPAPRWREELAGMGLPESARNVQAALLAATAKEGLAGNVNATKFLLGLCEQPREGEVYRGIPAECLGSAFVDVYRAILAREKRHFDFRGGRGSLKSSFAALVLVDDILRNPRKCGLALRQVADTMRDSVYAQIVWAIGVLGVAEEFECTVSPMRCVRVATGQVIYFRGGNEPDKIKSMKPPEGMYIGVLWYEEADQFRGAAAMRSINQSVLRGGDDGIVLRSYNTPVSQRHFINLQAREEGETRLIHHSHYKDAPRHWLGSAFFEEAENLRQANPRAFAHEYDGEATGTGLTVFDNVTERAITDREIAGFDRLYYGLDWGWYPHPTVFMECYYHAASRELFLYGELYRLKTPSADLAQQMARFKACPITADPGGGGNRSIADFVEWGFCMTAARKGPGSIEYGIKWLQSLNRIVIDPARCPNAARQFGLYEYSKDKDGNPVTGYPDEQDDCIDAVRYALEGVWRAGGG